MIDAIIPPQLFQWIDLAGNARKRARRAERVSIAFGSEDAGWDFERVLERYELLYEAGLVTESVRDRAIGALQNNADKPDSDPVPHDEDRLAALAATGRPLELDHRRILATALARLRGKLKDRPVVFELLPDKFTLLQLQQVVEALSGVGLHKQNFRRLVINNKLVEPTEDRVTQSRGRPAKLFRFRRDVLRERPTPGVGSPARRVTG